MDPSDALVPATHRIAVLRANALGDYLFAVPALEALRAAYPSAEIVLLGDAWHARVLAGRPGPVDRVEVVPRLPGVRGGPPDPVDEVRDFVERMRAERFDIALQLHGGGANSNPLVARFGARVTAGLRAADAPALDRNVPYVYYQPEVLRYLEAVTLVGAPPVVLEPRFAVTDADREEAAAVLGPLRRPLVVLHPGASDPRRRWSADRFAAVGRAFAEAGAQIAVTGTEPEAELVGRVAERVGGDCRRLAGAVGIGGLAAVLAAAGLVVSNDTGPLHLARAVGTATVGVYWIGNAINGGPVTRARHRMAIAWVTRCPVCGVDCTGDRWPARTAGTRCPHDVSFVDEVPVPEVVSYAADLLATDGRLAAGLTTLAA